MFCCFRGCVVVKTSKKKYKTISFCKRKYGKWLNNKREVVLHKKFGFRKVAEVFFSMHLLPFRAFCVQGPQNLMFVRPSVCPCPSVRLSVRLSVTLSRSSPSWSARVKKLLRKREKAWTSRERPRQGRVVSQSCVETLAWRTFANRADFSVVEIVMEATNFLRRYCTFWTGA